MPHVATSPSDLLETLNAVAHLDGDRLVIDDETGFRGAGIRDLAWTAAFTTDEATTAAAQWLVWEASQELGARSASIQDLYTARGRGEVHGFTVPAINIRAQTFDMARTVFEAAEQSDVGAVILELARSEQTYTYQRPIDYATAVLAGAIAAGWRAPVFIQGDHYQFNAKKYAADPEAMTEEIRRACRLAVDAGYRNIDIDTSTLVDLSKPTVDEQQRENYERAAELTALIRTLETDGVTISVGGEIGEVGKQELDRRGAARRTSTGYRRELDGARRARPGSRKVSVQTGTTHGGVPLPDGGVAEVKLDFEVLARARRDRARRTGWRAPCSTAPRRCPTSCSTASRRSRRPRSTSRPGFQNALYEHPAFPDALHRQIEAWCFANALDERKEGQTDQQFVYTTRKKAIGPFKRQLWDLSTKDEILAAQHRKVTFLFQELRVGRHPGAGRSVHPPGRVPSAAARGPSRRRPGSLGAPRRDGWPQSCPRRAYRAPRRRRGGGGRSGPRHEARGASRPRPAPTPIDLAGLASYPPVASTPPDESVTLTGAGDIASCSLTGDEATAAAPRGHARLGVHRRRQRLRKRDHRGVRAVLRPVMGRVPGADVPGDRQPRRGDRRAGRATSTTSGRAPATRGRAGTRPRSERGG